MGCGTVGALDIRAQCAGFIFALSIADQFVRSGAYERVLVVGAEVQSSGLDYLERGAATARLFGDGAGAALVGKGDHPGIRAVAMHTDGRQHDRFWCEYPSSRHHPVRMTTEDFRAGKHFLAVDLEAVRRFGEQSLPAVIGEVLEASGTKPDQIDHFVIAHLLPEVADSVAQTVGIKPDRLSVPSAVHGHLTAAALPVALSEAISSGRLGPGATVCLAACGAGFAWGAAVVTL